MNKNKELWIKLLAEQRQWIEKCGGDLAGYIANYHGVHHRTVENATAIYNADIGELQRIQERLGEHDMPRKQRHDRQTGAVLIFKPGVTKDEAQRMLRTCETLLQLQGMDVQEFNPQHGSPVFYVP